MTTILQRIEADTVVSWHWLENFLKTVVEEEVAMLAPLVAGAVSEVVKDAGALTTAGGWAAAIETVAKNIAPQLEAKGLQVAGASLASAIGGVLANLQATASGAPSVPLTAPPPAGPSAAAVAAGALPTA